MKMKLAVINFFVLCFPILMASELEQVEREAELIDFESIRSILRADGLEEVADEKIEVVETINHERKERIRRMYDLPSREDFFHFFSQYWLVKNAAVLKWDFQKPDYGIEEHFKELLESLGLVDLGFKILLLDSPVVAHGYLPAKSDEFILLLSVPFMRTLDLSRTEISLILLQEVLRAQMNFFEKKVIFDQLEKMFGQNFQGSEFDQGIFKKTLREYDKVIFENGYTFQEQFELTRRIDMLLRPREELWQTFYGLVGKIDTLVKTNPLYRQYPSLFPSPELQRGWLRPPGERRF